MLAVHLNTPTDTFKPVKLPDTPTKFFIGTSSASDVNMKLKPRKLTFSDDVQVQEYDVISGNDDEILCPATPEGSPPGSPLIDLDTIMDDRHSDDLFNSNTESEDEDEADILRGRRAKKAFKVKFGEIP